MEKTNKTDGFDDSKLNLFFDFQYKSLTETVNLLIKAAGAFYVTLMVALIGYLITQKVSNSTKTVIVISAVLLTALMFAVGIFVCWGIIHGIKDMRNTLERYDSKLFRDCGLDTFFKRGNKVVMFSVVLTIITVISIIILLGLDYLKVFQN